jgi:hypothetical protein
MLPYLPFLSFHLCLAHRLCLCREIRLCLRLFPSLAPWFCFYCSAIAVFLIAIALPCLLLCRENKVVELPC